MNDELIESFRERLLTLRKDLAGGVLALKEEGLALGTDGTQDIGDDAANSYARQMLLGLSERDRTVLREVDGALDRVEAGTFGLCEECGEEIAVARLRAIPHATLCVDCKANEESGLR